MSITNSHRKCNHKLLQLCTNESKILKEKTEDGNSLQATTFWFNFLHVYPGFDVLSLAEERQ